MNNKNFHSKKKTEQNGVEKNKIKNIYWSITVKITTSIFLPLYKLLLNLRITVYFYFSNFKHKI